MARLIGFFKEITDLSKEEQDYIQTELWNHKDTESYLKMLTEQQLEERFPKRKHFLFAHSIENNEYHAVWCCENEYIIVTIQNYNKRLKVFEIKIK